MGEKTGIGLKTIKIMAAKENKSNRRIKSNLINRNIDDYMKVIRL